MARFLGMLTFSTSEAARMIQDGPGARRDFFDLIVREGGGTVEGFWLTNVGDWDLVCLVDLPDGTPALGAASTLARKAAGLTNRERWIELVDVDEVDAVVGTMASRPPRH
jgi:uncharacterized protein with GYD domain